MTAKGERRLGPEDLAVLTALRRDLHRRPELAGLEERTSATIADALGQAGADLVVRGLGGHGLLGLFRGEAPGARVLVRCELDALPISEQIEIDHGSEVDGVAHKCGHDGHMAMVMGAALMLGRRRPTRGEIVLMFQPAEETGEGALAVIGDSAFASFEPDSALAVHNLPGFPLGCVVLRPGPFASASKGVVIALEGATAHASEPNRGRSPTAAVAALLTELEALPQRTTSLHEAAQVTVIHARLGERAFGTAPGTATVLATLRAHEQALAEELAARCSRLAMAVAAAHGLRCQVSFSEEFPATWNDHGVVATISRVADELGLERVFPAQPFPWSEDFGHIASRWPGALFGLGSGAEHPALHSPGYDFPDDLIGVGASILCRTALLLAKQDL
ncbi:MAG: amidohydrolase [Polyangia bacterium]|nr:amidohydrolase [Polyangia bacterium]